MAPQVGVADGMLPIQLLLLSQRHQLVIVLGEEKPFGVLVHAYDGIGSPQPVFSIAQKKYDCFQSVLMLDAFFMGAPLLALEQGVK